MNGALFPTWQVDRTEYGHACAHLGLKPDDTVFRRLDGYLAQAALTAPRLGAFARALAHPPLTRWRVARLDLATRLFFPSHPVRHLLNAMIALHECDGDGYRQLSRTWTGPAVWALLAAEGTRFVASLLLTLPWLVGQRLRFALAKGVAGGRSLAGRRVLVTGVARGLGRDLMLECLERGAQVVGTVRSEASRRDLTTLLPREVPLTLVVADLSLPGAAIAALAAAGLDPSEVDFALLCAGTKHDGHAVLDLERLRDTLQVNMLAPAEIASWLCAPATPRPVGLGIVSSIGRWHGMHSSAGYNASKAALSVWAESLEMDLARRGGPRPTVTIVEPGLFESGMTGKGGLRARLFVPRRRLAGRIVDVVAGGRRSLRSPAWFAALTWGVCLAGRGLRLRLFARTKAGQQP